MSRARSPQSDSSSLLSLSADDKEYALDLTGFVSVEEGGYAGEGGYGKVYRGKWTRNHPVFVSNSPPEIAIKVIQGMYLSDEKKRERIFKVRLTRPK